MINGTYRVTLSLPIGAKSGTISFADNGGTLSGTIRAMGSSSPFTGHSSGNHFTIRGVLNAGFFRFSFTADGTADGQSLRGTARSNAGSFPINGTKVS